MGLKNFFGEVLATQPKFLPRSPQMKFQKSSFFLMENFLPRFHLLEKMRFQYLLSCEKLPDLPPIVFLLGLAEGYFFTEGERGANKFSWEKLNPLWPRFAKIVFGSEEIGKLFR